MTTDTILICTAIIAAAFALAAGEGFYRSIIDRRRTLELYPDRKVLQVNMSHEAQWMARWIYSCATYEQFCAIEDKLQVFADSYRECEGFAGVMTDLYQFTEMQKKYVRNRERVVPMDLRYPPE